MVSAVQHVFNTTAATYDADRARLIPGFDRFYASALDQIPRDSKRILDLGAGTGLLSAFLRDRFPHAHIHLIDNSEPMLAKSRARFVNDAGVTYQLDDYTTTDFGTGYDAIVSALSVHHLENPAKQALFARIHSALRLGGIFINAEQVLSPSPDLEQIAKAAWLNEVRALGATESQIASSLMRQQEDRCATIDDQIRWLKEAGYSGTTCVFARGRFAVLVGIKCAQAASPPS